MTAILVSAVEGGNFNLALADGGVLPVQNIPATASGVVTVTASAPITSSGGSAPNVALVAGADLDASGHVEAISGASPIAVTPAVFSWVTGAVGPEWTQAIADAAATPQPMTFAPQAPNAGAGSTSTGTPGNFAITLAAPTSTGVEATLHLARVGGITYDVGAFPGAPTFLTVWVGVTPAANNFTWLYSAQSVASGGMTLAIPGASNGVWSIFQGSTSGPALMAVGVSTTGQGVNLTSNNSQFGSGVGVVKLTNATTAPTVNPTAGAFLYAVAGALTARGSSGTVTTLAPAEPHCPVCGSDFGTEHWHPEKGEYLAICLVCLANELGERPWIRRKKPSASSPPSAPPSKGKGKMTASPA